jgi:predicted nucleotide-binding protein (sugar kinase/HSP70/actin superfamily)
MAGLTARGKSLLKNRYLAHAEHQVYDWCSPLLDNRREPPMSEALAASQRFLPLNFEGEAVLTVGRAIRFVEQGAALVVNAAPFGCMPGTLTAAILQQVQQERQVPIISQYYDGEDGLNRRLAIYLKEASDRLRRGEVAERAIDW